MIRPLNTGDHAGWLPLWQANMEHKVDDAVTAETWRRICDPATPVGGLCAVNDDGRITGICHYILHPTTGQLNPVCYMQDLFIDPAHRRKGIARNLVTALAALGQESGWARVYWLAEGKNKAAQSLYQSLGYKLDFTFHVLPLNLRG